MIIRMAPSLATVKKFCSRAAILTDQALMKVMRNRLQRADDRRVESVKINNFSFPVAVLYYLIF
jgi:hypothetical protein